MFYVRVAYCSSNILEVLNKGNVSLLDFSESYHKGSTADDNKGPHKNW